MIPLLLSLASAADVACTYRGLDATVRWSPEGQVLFLDGDEVLIEVEADPMPAGANAGCHGDGVRFIWGTGEQATLSVGRQSIDFAPLLDVLPAERFDPGQAAFRRARYHGRKGDPEGVWRWIEPATGALNEAQGAQVAGWLDGSGQLALCEAAWSLTPEAHRDTAPGQARRNALAAARLAAGDPDGAEALYAPFVATDLAACNGLADVLEARGKAGPAKRQRGRCTGA